MILARITAVVAALTLLLPTAAHATGTVGVVTASDAYLRTYPQSWFIGTLVTADHFDIQGAQSGYYWGYAQGDYNGCAWIVASAVGNTGSASGAPNCGPPQQLPLPDSAHAPSDGYDTNGDGVPDRLTAPYQVTCQSAGLYRNYRGGQHLGLAQVLPAGTPIGWRWTTADGRSAVVRHDASDTWGYMLVSCIAPR